MSSPSRLRKQEGTAQNCKDSDNKHKKRDRRKQKQKKTKTNQANCKIRNYLGLFLDSLSKGSSQNWAQGLTSKNKFIRGLHVKNNLLKRSLRANNQKRRSETTSSIRCSSLSNEWDSSCHNCSLGLRYTVTGDINKACSFSTLITH